MTKVQSKPQAAEARSFEVGASPALNMVEWTVNMGCDDALPTRWNRKEALKTPVQSR